MANKLTATLVDKQNLAGSYWCYRLQFEGDFLYEAGQYVSIKVNDSGLRRSYSIASRPNGKVIELLIDITPNGPGSQFFNNCKVGDQVEVLGPVGKFVLKKLDVKKKLFIATGSGIAPIRAMLQECEVLGLDRRLVWGMRYETDLFWQDMGGKIVLSKPSENWKGRVGHVGDVLVESLVGYEVYLCGNKAMVEEMVEKVKGLGVDPADIYFEKFG